MLTITGCFSWKRLPPCHVAFRLHSHLVTLTLFPLYAVSCKGARFAHACKPIGSFRNDVSSVHKSRPAPGYIITLEGPVLLARWLCLQYIAAFASFDPWSLRGLSTRVPCRSSDMAEYVSFFIFLNPGVSQICRSLNFQDERTFHRFASL